MTSKITLSGIECSCRLGVPDEERAKPQRIVLELELRTKWQSPGPTLDYYGVWKTAKGVAEERPFKLVEELGEAVASRLLKEFAVLDGLWMRVRKWPSVMPGVEVSVEGDWNR